MIQDITWDGIATLAAALLGAVVVVAGYFVQRSIARRTELGELYAGAISAIDDYREAPYRILRKDGTYATRIALTNHVSDIQSRLSHFDALLTQRAPRQVLAAYRDTVEALRREAGQHMREAWAARPTRRDRDVPLGISLAMPDTHARRQALITTMAPGARLLRSAVPVLIVFGIAVPAGGWASTSAGLIPPFVAAPIEIVSAVVGIAALAGLVIAPARVGRRRVATSILTFLGAAIAIAISVLATAQFAP